MTPTQRAADAIGAALQAYRSDGTELCVTFSASDAQWLQVTWNQLNVSYPLSRAPDQHLRLPPGIQLLSWEAGRFATFSHAGGAEAAAFLAGCATRLHSRPLDEHWSREEMFL